LSDVEPTSFAVRNGSRTELGRTHHFHIVLPGCTSDATEPTSRQAEIKRPTFLVGRDSIRGCNLARHATVEPATKGVDRCSSSRTATGSIRPAVLNMGDYHPMSTLLHRNLMSLCPTSNVLFVWTFLVQIWGAMQGRYRTRNCLIPAVYSIPNPSSAHPVAAAVVVCYACASFAFPSIWQQLYLAVVFSSSLFKTLSLSLICPPVNARSWSPWLWLRPPRVRLTWR